MITSASQQPFVIQILFAFRTIIIQRLLSQWTFTLVLSVSYSVGQQDSGENGRGLNQSIAYSFSSYDHQDLTPHRHDVKMQVKVKLSL
jgi:hypothetical protein